MRPHQPRRSARSRRLQHHEQHPSSHDHDAGANPRRQPTMSLRCGPRIESGSFGMLPGHADLLTALVPSVVRWRTADGAARFCAVRGGVFTVSAGRNVSVACREGVVGDSLDELEAKVRTVRAQQLEADRKARVEQIRVHALAVRQLVRYLRPNPASAAPIEREAAVVRGTDFDRLARAAQRAVEREAAGSCRSRTLARRPARPDRGARLDRSSCRRCSVSSSAAGSTAAFGTGIFFSAPLLMVGAAIGFWSAWRWMHRQGVKQR